MEPRFDPCGTLVLISGDIFDFTVFNVLEWFDCE